MIPRYLLQMISAEMASKYGSGRKRPKMRPVGMGTPMRPVPGRPTYTPPARRPIGGVDRQYQANRPKDRK